MSLIMLEVCRIISSNRADGYSSFIEPDDTLEMYIDFLEEINSCDWINDESLLDLIDKVFCRKDKEKKCPKCGYDGAFDIYEIIGGCEGEVTKVHCPDCTHIFEPRKEW